MRAPGTGLCEVWAEKVYTLYQTSGQLIWRATSSGALCWTPTPNASWVWLEFCGGSASPSPEPKAGNLFFTGARTYSVVKTSELRLHMERVARKTLV